MVGSAPLGGSGPSRTARDGSELLARAGYDRYGAELYRFALARLGDDGAAQDAVQETIVRAWRAADRFDDQRGSLRTWLFAIIRRVVIDQAGAAGRRPRPVDPAEERGSDVAELIHQPSGSAADEVGAVADRDLITRAPGLISHDHRTALVETFLRDRSYDEVARDLGVPVSTLRSRVFHGLRQLRTALALEAEMEGEA